MRKTLYGLITLLAACATTASDSAPRSGITAVHVLDCGQLTISDRSQFSPGVGVGQPISLTDTCYVIRHRSGTMLWDTGIPDAIAAQPNGIKGETYHVQRAQTLVAQLSRLGLTPDSIAYLGISHLHFDHAGNANLFTRATWLVQRVEYDAAFSERAAQMHFDPTQYSALRNSKVQQLSGDHDVFGDSSVVILSTPGHTIGHQSLLLRLPSNAKIVLSGDLWHFRENRQARRVPGFNYDRAQTIASMDRVEQLIRLHNARLIIQHDPQDVGELGSLPATLR